MNMNVRRSLTVAALTALAMTTTSTARATEPPGQISVGEVEGTGMDVSALRDTAEAEVRQIDTSKLSLKRRYVVSFSVTRGSISDAVSFSTSAILRDAKSGAMIAFIEAGAQAAGTTSDEATKRVAHAAVRSAMRRIPTALGAK